MIDLTEHLPESLTNKSVLEIGCWEGHICVECLNRGAREVVGIDTNTSEKLSNNLKNHDFKFIQLDLFSESFLQLPRYDYVICFGVLYHVSDVMSALIRLRNKTREKIIIETIFNNLSDKHSTLLYHKKDTLKGNFSNWWTANETCYHDMMTAAGFVEIDIKSKSKARFYGDVKFYRGCITANVSDNISIEKIHSRRSDRLGVYGGKR